MSDPEEPAVAQYEEDQSEAIEDQEGENGLDEIPFANLRAASKKMKKKTAKSNADQDITEKSSVKRKRKEVESRSSKHAPQEMSSRRPVKRLRTVVELPKSTVRDPRFDSLSGRSKPDLFNKTYSFLQDNRKAELSSLKSTMAKAKKSASVSKVDKEALQQQVTRLQSQIATDDKAAREQEAMREWKKTEQEKRREGKQPFFLKDKDRRKVVADARAASMSAAQLKKSKARRDQKQETRERRDRAPQRLPV